MSTSLKRLEEQARALPARIYAAAAASISSLHFVSNS